MFGNDAEEEIHVAHGRGETLGAFCLTEAAAGRDAAGIQARRARRELLQAQRNQNPGLTGSVAGVLLVFAKPIRRRVERHFCLLVELSFQVSSGPAMKTRWVSGLLVSGDFAE
jgi:alkylation response protein AidB-like acyl-CoA dehydrogenase